MFIIQCPILWYAKVCALPSARSSYEYVMSLGWIQPLATLSKVFLLWFRGGPSERVRAGLSLFLLFAVPSKRPRGQIFCLNWHISFYLNTSCHSGCVWNWTALQDASMRCTFLFFADRIPISPFQLPTPDVGPLSLKKKLSSQLQLKHRACEASFHPSHCMFRRCRVAPGRATDPSWFCVTWLFTGCLLVGSRKSPDTNVHNKTRL